MKFIEMNNIIKYTRKPQTQPLTADEVLDLIEIKIWDRICEMWETLTGAQRYDIHLDIKCSDYFPGFNTLNDFYEQLIRRYYGADT